MRLESIKDLVRDLTPPILTRAARSVIRRSARPEPDRGPRGEKSAEWYDAAFEASDGWRAHYAESQYYFLWTVIADRLARDGLEPVLDVGCGAGQLASLLRDKGIRSYHGLDFSSKRVEQARRACPEFSFTVGDAFESDLFDAYEYRVVVSTEFLEHVEGDLEIIARVRPGTRFIGTVPNFPFVSHVRHFADANEVSERYRRALADLRVDTFLANGKGTKFFLLDGRTPG